MRHTDLELWFFLIWFLVSLVAAFVLNPIRTEKVRCGIICYDNVSWLSALTTTLFLLCLTFCFYMVLASFLYDFDKHITDLPQLVDGNRLFWVPLLIALGAAILVVFLTWAGEHCCESCATCLPRSLWASVAFGLVIAFYLHYYIPCSEDDSVAGDGSASRCFATRFALSIAISMVVSGILSVVVMRCFGDIIFEMQEHLVIGFTMSLSLMIVISDFDYWQSHNSIYPLIATLSIAVVRFIVSMSSQYCACCRKDYVQVGG